MKSGANIQKKANHPTVPLVTCWGRGEVMMVMVMVATLTRSTAACSSVKRSDVLERVMVRGFLYMRGFV